eukprot:403367744
MKIAIISAILFSLAVAQTTTQWDAKTRTCTQATEATACANLTNACCGSIQTKVGTAAAVTVNRCIQRNLAEDIPSLSYVSGTTTTTVAYACLNQTRPSTYEVYTKCNNETTCSSGYCCATVNYTIASQATRNLTQAQCIPGSVGRDNGSIIQHLFGNTASNLGDINVQSMCYASLNPSFYASSAVFIRGALAIVITVVLAINL